MRASEGVVMNIFYSDKATFSSQHGSVCLQPIKRSQRRGALQVSQWNAARLRFCFFVFFLSPFVYLIPPLYVSCVWYEGPQIKLQSKQARARRRWGVCGSTALEVVCENAAPSGRNVGAVSSFLSRVFHSEDETVSRPAVWFLLLGGEGQSDWHCKQECLTLSPCGNVRLKALIQVRWGLKLGWCGSVFVLTQYNSFQ